MKYADLIKKWKNKDFNPITLLHGDEEFYIDQAAKYAENHILEESEKAFNQITVYGKDINAKDLMDQCYQYPMMAAFRLIILKEAQSMRDIDKLEPYFLKPSEQTILVITHKHKKIDKRKKFWKAISKNADLMESKKVYESALSSFISSFLKSENYSIDHHASELIKTYIGTNLTNLTNELSKLILNLPKGSQITTAEVEKYIGISKEYNIFEFINVLGRRDSKTAFRMIKYFGENPKQNPLPMILFRVSDYFQKLLIVKQNTGIPDGGLASKIGVNPYFLNDYKSSARNFKGDSLIHIYKTIKELDLKSKGISARRVNDDALLKELVISVLN